MSACHPACHDDTSSRSPAPAAPRQQFELQRVTFEERRQNSILWSGEGRTAEGELRACRMQDLTLHRLPQQQGEAPIAVRAPFGDLRFAEGAATFSTPTVTHSSGAKLYAARAVYSEAQQCLLGTGPVAFWTPSCVAYARDCALKFTDNRIDVDGPVQGLLNALPRQP